MAKNLSNHQTKPISQGERTTCGLPADRQRGGHGNDSVLEAMRAHVGEYCHHDWARSIAMGYNYLWDELEREPDPGLILLGRLVAAVCELCDAAQCAHVGRVRAEAKREAGVQGKLL